MLKMTMIAAVAATTLALGLGGTSTPAEAKHKSGHITLCIGDCFYGYGHRYRHHHRWHNHWHCHWVKVKKHGKWRKVEKCHSHFHGPGHHY